MSMNEEIDFYLDKILNTKSGSADTDWMNALLADISNCSMPNTALGTTIHKVLETSCNIFFSPHFISFTFYGYKYILN